MSNNDKLAGLDPAFRTKFLWVKGGMDAWLSRHLPGRYVIVTEGKRSMARQVWLYAAGRTRPGPKVTWTMQSMHFKGLAVDIAFGGGKPYDVPEAAWEYYGHLCRQHGLVWGGDWGKTPDRPHCEAQP